MDKKEFIYQINRRHFGRNGNFDGRHCAALLKALKRLNVLFGDRVMEELKDVWPNSYMFRCTKEQNAALEDVLYELWGTDKFARYGKFNVCVGEDGVPSVVEITLPRPIYTVDLLYTLHSKHPQLFSLDYLGSVASSFYIAWEHYASATDKKLEAVIRHKRKQIKVEKALTETKVCFEPKQRGEGRDSAA